MAIRPELLDPHYGEESFIRIVRLEEAADILKERVESFLHSTQTSRKATEERFFHLERGIVFFGEEDGKTLATVSLELQRAGLWVMMNDFGVKVDNPGRRRVMPRRDRFGHKWQVEYVDYSSSTHQGLSFRRISHHLGTSDASVVWRLRMAAKVPHK